MLRDVPPIAWLADDEVVIDTPGISEAPQPNTADTFDDIFGSTPVSPHVPADHAGDYGHEERAASDALSDTRRVLDDPSDIPRLRSTHVTNGYREGIAVSKEQFMQEGFDEGYSLGAELGLKAGWCLGALEGIAHAVAARSIRSAEASTVAVTTQGVRDMLQEAEAELRVQSLFGPEFFGQDGLWSYPVPHSDNGEEDVTFAQVAAAHPSVLKWMAKVSTLSSSIGLHLHE